MLITQMIRNMTTVLSWLGNVEPWRTALGPSCHRAAMANIECVAWFQGYAEPTT